MKRGTCRRCGVRVGLVTTRDGMHVLVDPRPTPLGNVALLKLQPSAEATPEGAFRPTVEVAVLLDPCAPQQAAEFAEAPRLMAHHGQCSGTRPGRVRGFHTCAVPGCSRRIPKRFELCMDHWRLVDRVTKASIVDLRAEIARGDDRLMPRLRSCVRYAVAQVLVALVERRAEQRSIEEAARA